MQILIINQSNSKNYQKILDEGGKIAPYWKWFTAHNINTKKIVHCNENVRLELSDTRRG